MAIDFNKIRKDNNLSSTPFGSSIPSSQPNIISKNITEELVMPKYTYQAPTPRAFRQAFVKTTISKEQQKYNEQLLIKELKSKDGKVAAIAQGVALGILDPFQVSKYFKQGQQNPEVSKLIEGLTFGTDFKQQSNPRATQLGLTPYKETIVNGRIKAETVGNLIGSLIPVDLVGLGVSKVFKLAMSKYGSKLVGELTSQEIDDVVKTVAKETNQPETSVRQLLLESPDAKKLRQDVVEEQSRISKGEPIRLGGETVPPKTYTGSANPIVDDLTTQIGKKVQELKNLDLPTVGRNLSYKQIQQAKNLINSQLDDLSTQLTKAENVTPQQIQNYINEFKQGASDYMPTPVIPTANVAPSPPLQFKTTIAQNIPRADVTMPQTNISPSVTGVMPTTSQANIPQGVAPLPTTSKVDNTVGLQEMPTEPKPTFMDTITSQDAGIVPEGMQPFDIDLSKNRLHQAKLSAQEAIQNQQAQLDTDITRQQAKQGDFVTINEMNQQVRNAEGAVESFLDLGFIKRNGDVIKGQSFTDVFNRTFKKFPDLEKYMFNMHNISRRGFSNKALKSLQEFEVAHPEMATLTADELLELKKSGEFGQILVSEYEDLIKAYKNAPDKPVIKASAEQSAEIVRNMETKNPNLKKAAQELYDYWDNVMKETIVPDMISEKDYLKLGEIYPFYVPTYRLKDKFIDKFGSIIDGYQSRGKIKSMKSPQPIKEAVGDVSELVPLADQYAMLINRYVRAYKKNNVVLNLLDSVTKDPQAWADKVRIVSKEKSKLLGKSADDMLDEFDEIDLKDLKNGMYTITGHRNGEDIKLQVTKRIFEEMRALFGQEDTASFGHKALGIIKGTGRSITNPLKSLLTGHNPLFGLRNPSRDLVTGWIQSIENNPIKFGANLKDSIVGVKNQSPEFLTFKGLGANRAGYYSQEKGYQLSYHANRKSNPFEYVWNKLGSFNEVTEEINRFSEYLAGIKKWGDTPEGRIKAMYAAAEVTTNFSPRGYLVDILDAWIPYLSAGVQGITKSTSTMAKHPIKTALKGVGSITAVSLILDQINKQNPNYIAEDNRVKDTYFMIPNMASIDESGYPTKFIKIPKAREYAVIFGDLIERSLRAARGEEDAWKGFGKTLKTNFLPPYQDVTKPLREAMRAEDEGVDFAGRPIVPQSLRGLDPSAQYTERTSGFSKKLGELTQNLPSNLQISPVKSDYLINAYTSWIGQMGAGLLSSSPTNPKEFAKGVLTPFQRGFESDPLFTNKNVQYFYEALDRANTDAKNMNKRQDIPSSVKTPLESQASRLNAISKRLTELSKYKNSISSNKEMTNEERDAEIRKIQKQYVEIATQGYELSKQFKLQNKGE